MNFCSAVSRSAKLEPRPDCMAMFQRSRCNAHLSFHVARWATDGEYSFLMDQLLSLPSPPGPRTPPGPPIRSLWIRRGRASFSPSWAQAAQVCSSLQTFATTTCSPQPLHKYPSLRGGVTECLGVIICLLTPPVGHRPPSLPREKARNDYFAWTNSKT